MSLNTKKDDGPSLGLQTQASESSPKKRPHVIGIGGWQDDRVEIESPWRKKKGGLNRLTLTNIADAQPRKQEALE